MLLNTLILIYGGILFISTLMALFLWNTYRHVLLRELFIFWVTGITAFIGQGIFSHLDFKGFLVFSVNWFTIIYLLRILSLATGIVLPFKAYHSIIFGSVVIGALNLFFGGEYFHSSILFCLACSSVLLHGAFQKIRVPEYRDKIIIGYRVLLIIDAIHFLDYPFVRPEPDLAILGFSVTLIFFFSFAIYVPIFIIRRISADYTKNLENQVAIRTMQLSESQLQLNVAFENLKAKNSQIESLLVSNKSKLSSLVHDIANPLQVVGFHFKQLSDSLVADPDVSKRIQKIQLAISSITQIMNEAKANHALDTNLETGVLTKVNFNQVLGESLELFQHKLEAKRIQVKLDVPMSAPVMVYGNAGWLKNQILSNVISNAIKFSPNGGIIQISVGCTEATQGKVLFRIKDDGKGVSENMKDKIFDLNQLTSTIGTNGEIGTGFGLPIVRQYLQLMGGRICLVEDQLPGACFEMEFKRVV